METLLERWVVPEKALHNLIENKKEKDGNDKIIVR
jgi:hypothetical protein